MEKKENFLFILISLVVVASLYLLKITPKDIGNFDNLLLGTIALNSIGIGFLVASISIVPSLSNNDFFSKLRDLKTDQKLLKLLGRTIRFLLFISVISIILIFSNTLEILQNYLTWAFYLWVFLLTYSFLLIDNVVRIFLKVLKSIQGNR